MAITGADWEMFKTSKRSLNAQLRVSYFKNDLDGGLLLRDYLDRNTTLGVGGNIGFFNEDETDRYMLYSAVSNSGFANE